MFKKKFGKYNMTENCFENQDTLQSDEELKYLPLEAIKRVLKFANIELDKQKNNSDDENIGEFTNKNNSEENCYDFETAWLVIIKDIINNLESLKNYFHENLILLNLMSDSNKVQSILNRLEEGSESKEKFEKMKSNFNKIHPQIDLMSMFKQIINVGKKRFFIQDNECIENKKGKEECKFIENIEKIINSEVFETISNLLGDIKSNSDLQTFMNKSIPELTSKNNLDINTAIDYVITLLEMTLPIMNKKENLGEDKDFDTKVNSILNFFNPIKGGGNKVNKSLKKYKKSKIQRRRTKKMKGGYINPPTLFICKVIAFVVGLLVIDSIILTIPKAISKHITKGSFQDVVQKYEDTLINFIFIKKNKRK